MRDKVESEQIYVKQQSTTLQQNTQNPSSPPLPTTASPPSPSSSPTHEFSFTISLPPATPQHHNLNTYNIATNNNYKTNTLPPTSPAAIDLSPAGDIFFHGHLLPLHHLPDSPRSSTNSLDSFTLPVNLLYYQSNPNGNTSFHCHHQTTLSDSDESDVTTTNHNPPKSKSFSIFGIPKYHEDQTKDRINRCKKLKLDFGQLIKKYIKLVKPLLSFPKSKRSNSSTRIININHQSYSFSGNSLSRKPVEMRRGLLSAPASMRTSPANSGILRCVGPAKSGSESSMEELHTAIQAAIAHCKNSIAMEDKIQSQN